MRIVAQIVGWIIIPAMATLLVVGLYQASTQYQPTITGHAMQAPAPECTTSPDEFFNDCAVLDHQPGAGLAHRLGREGVQRRGGPALLGGAPHRRNRTGDPVIAVLFTYDPKTERSFATAFTDGPDPVASAWGLKASIESDWPGAVWSVGADQEAKEVHGEALMATLLGTDETDLETP